LFNATRFALINGAVVPEGPLSAEDLTDADAWILDRLDEVIGRTTELLADFQFAKAAEGLYHFAWDEFCDWYVELAKVQLRDDDAAETTRAVLGTVLDGVLRLLHPFVPFVTEELWTSLTGGETLVIAAWPAPSTRPANPSARTFIADLDKLVTEIRRFRSDQGLAANRAVPARLIGPTGLAGPAAALTRLNSASDGFAPTASIEVSLVAGPVTIELDTSEAVDVDAEKARLRKDLAAAEKEIAGTAAKLGNDAFLGKAPEKVVAGIRDRHATAVAEQERLLARLTALGAQA
jgi:valyl-tRNA synthetase